MLINSHRFGPLEIPENKIISMARPVLGFEKLGRFCLIEREEFWPFLWMQSIEDPAVAFIVVNPVLFKSDYRIEINPNEISELEATTPELIETYVIANVSDDWKLMTINLQGPILINTSNNKAKQLVLMNSEYKVQQIVFEHEKITSTVTAKAAKEPVGV
ncbi:MAG TPA: flagellar assembly protein FliW [candidate division Zixibacteria bacterium]|nr:flagellar assembly protein FliW [candidate division Zixibacteria bacterium]